MGISIALPYIFLFYLLLGLLEDTGLLTRFTVNIEWFLKKLGLPGKAFIPLVLGIGCTAPACSATRVLSCKKEQFRTASLFTFVPCSSRIAIILGVVGFYGGMPLALSVFVTAFVAGLLWIFALRKLITIESEPLLLELPPYRKPLLKNVLAKSWIRMKDFVYVVIPLLALGGIGYGVLETLGLTTVFVEAPFSNYCLAGFAYCNDYSYSFWVFAKRPNRSNAFVRTKQSNLCCFNSPPNLYLRRSNHHWNSMRNRLGHAHKRIWLQKSNNYDNSLHPLRIIICWFNLENRYAFLN